MDRVGDADAKGIDRACKNPSLHGMDVGDAIGEVAGEVAGAVLDSTGDLVGVLIDSDADRKHKRKRRRWSGLAVLLVFGLLMGGGLWAIWS